MATADCPFCQKLLGLHELPDEDVVWQFTHSVAFLGPWQFYQGYCILVARRHATELSQLGNLERTAYLDEMCRLARAIEIGFHPRKLNYELLGNQVPHLHWHLFPRFAGDPDALHPVWQAVEQAQRDPEQRKQLQTGTLSRADTTKALRDTLQNLATGPS